MSMLISNIHEVKQQIADALATIDGLHTCAYRPSPMLQTPCAFVTINNIQYGYTMTRLNQKNFFDIQLLISRTKDLSESQSDIDEYLDYSGNKSIAQAVENGTYPSLNHIHLTAMTQYGGFLYDDTPYFGCLFRAETF
jgi:hypothetical protein